MCKIYEHGNQNREGEEVMDRQCKKCGITENLTRHHIKPRSKGGKNNILNYITLCRECHDKEHDQYGNNV